MPERKRPETLTGRGLSLARTSRLSLTGPIPVPSAARPVVPFCGWTSSATGSGSESRGRREEKR